MSDLPFLFSEHRWKHRIGAPPLLTPPPPPPPPHPLPWEREREIGLHALSGIVGTVAGIGLAAVLANNWPDGAAS
jgi:hypothetical protein